MGVRTRREKRARDGRRPGARRASVEFASAREIASGAEWTELDASGLRRLALSDAWRRAVGSAVGAVTRVSSCAKHSLEVEVLDPAWQGNLERLAPQIVERLNQELGGTTQGGARRGRVTSLRFRALAASMVAPAGELRDLPGARSLRGRIPGDLKRPPGREGTGRGSVIDGESLRRRLCEVVKRYPRAKS